MTGYMLEQAETTMNALYVRFFCAVLLLATAMVVTAARAAEPAPAHADSVITGQSFGLPGCCEADRKR